MFFNTLKIVASGCLIWLELLLVWHFHVFPVDGGTLVSFHPLKIICLRLATLKWLPYVYVVVEYCASMDSGLNPTGCVRKVVPVTRQIKYAGHLICYDMLGTGGSSPGTIMIHPPHIHICLLFYFLDFGRKPVI